ncbi:hypothetical protein L7F22_066045 [Adiantum nelumboides]|nr:hypothetical protein [Adiantum nelumboides]
MEVGEVDYDCMCEARDEAGQFGKSWSRHRQDVGTRSLSFAARSITHASSTDSSRSFSVVCQSLNGFGRRDCLCGDYQDGCRRGSRVFVPSSISIPSGEKVAFLNNKSFSHNMIFEKNGVPEGVQVELISHNDYMNDEGQQFVVTLKDKGIFRFFCEPHRAASMFGEITVT